MLRFSRSNGITEGFHTKMEMLSRRAFGFRNFSNYRLRVLAHCVLGLGICYQQSTSPRGDSPVNGVEPPRRPEAFIRPFIANCNRSLRSRSGD